MLTLAQNNVVESLAKELVQLIRDAIVNKPIKRISRRKVNGKYVDKVFSAPVNASGELAKTIRYEITETSLSIYANDYIYDLIYGKPPNKSMASLDINLESKIKTWLAYKGISDESNTDTLAYYISNKIHKFGSSIYLAYQGKNSGLLENIINDDLIAEYNSKFTKQLELELIEAFNGK